MGYKEEIARRRTFGIISHPDAGKTTLTEKLLLFGGAIHVAGAVKSNKIKKTATSDFMEIERQRGISVATSVMGFEYNGIKINILDTPGHQDFAEDTFRTLTACDSVIIVIDAAKGVETQTRKLMQVCRMRKTPVIVFINKLDRPAHDPFDLLDEIEKELQIHVNPLSWPIGSGDTFKGVYNIYRGGLYLFNPGGQTLPEGIEIQDLNSDELVRHVGERDAHTLCENLELIQGVYPTLEQNDYLNAEVAPVFFGSALTNFGVETFLQHFLDMTTSPLPRNSSVGLIDPFKEDFSAFVFKIQANMNKAHRDRIAFMRICSGKFTAGMEANHVQGGKKIRLSQPQQMMAQERHIVEEAYAGDIIGVFDPGIFSIGDTICTSNKKFQFDGIPTFAPEHFARVRQIDTMKRKQFIKGISQIAQEGAIQIFQEYNTGMEEIIVGVVGVLQFEVLEYRLKNEYNVDIKLEPLPYEHIRWIENPEEVDVNRIVGTSDMKKIKDLKGNPLLVFANSWSVNMVLERNEGLKLSEFGKNN